jgi:hypothetical protein
LIHPAVYKNVIGAEKGVSDIDKLKKAAEKPPNAAFS